jgi:rhodanese-related sulfurtransferase
VAGWCVVFVGACVDVIAAPGTRQQEERTAEETVDPQQVVERLADVQLIDVRELDEWEAGRIEGARHIPMSELGDRLGEIDKDRPLVAVCRSGARSGRVVDVLRSRGYDAENLEGGMQAWEQAGLPFSAPAGGPGRVA